MSKHILNPPVADGLVILGNNITLTQIRSVSVNCTSPLKLSGLASFEMQAMTGTPTFCSDKIVINNFKIDVRIIAHDSKPSIFKLSSTALKLNRYIRVSTRNKWYNIYNNETTLPLYTKDGNYSYFDFDLRGELVLRDLNEDIADQRALDFSMLNDDETTNVELVGTDGTIRAHSCVLAAASPYMRAAFFGDYIEAEEGRLKLPHTNVAALKLLKQFVYTGYADATKDSSTLITALSLASLILMPNFAAVCLSSLDDFTATELWMLLLEATEHKQDDWILEIISRLDLGKVGEIREQLNKKEETKENIESKEE